MPIRCHPVSAVALRIRLANEQNSGWVAFDDASLSQVEIRTNLVTNPGFESGSGWTEVGDADFPVTSFPAPWTRRRASL